MEISNDKTCNPELREEVQSLRGGLVSVAERNELPERFQVTPNKDHPRMEITDNTTGRTTVVPLFGYGEVRKVLNDLFSGV